MDTGFPTLYYIKAGNKTPTKFTGERNAKGMWKYIKENHTQKDKINKQIEANQKAKVILINSIKH